MFNILIPLLVLFSTVECNDYMFPSYYGYFNLNFFHYENLTNGKLTLFELHQALDMDSNNSTIYFADTNKHCIYKITDDSIEKIAGTQNQSGNRIGHMKYALFNNPSSVAFYRYNSTSSESENNMKAYVVANGTCEINSSGCVLNSNNLPNNIGLDNLRFYPPIVQFPQFSENDNTQDSFLYVSDTSNHCIKRINLITQIVEIVAGKCGQTGFMDGPFGFNRLNLPKNIGITRNGVIIFFDQGNQYMRMIVNGYVYTLLNGACIKYGQSRKINNKFVINNVLCYEDWIEQQTKSSIDHVFDPKTTIQTCTEQYSKCKQ